MANRRFKLTTFITLITLILIPIQAVQAANLKIAIVYAEGGRGDNGANDLAAVGLE